MNQNKYTYRNIKKGWKIRFDDKECIVLNKKYDLCSLKAGSEYLMMHRGQKFEVLETLPKYYRENDLQRYAESKCNNRGWKYLHIGNSQSRKTKNNGKGWPDMIIFNGKGNTFFLELKTLSKMKKEQTYFRNWAMMNKYSHYIASTPGGIDQIMRHYE